MYTLKNLEEREKFDNIVAIKNDKEDFDSRPMIFLDGNFEKGDCFAIPYYKGTDLKLQRFGIERGKTYEELTDAQKANVNTTKCLYVPVWNEERGIKKADAANNMKRLYPSLFCRPRFVVNDNMVRTGKIELPDGEPAKDFQSTGDQKAGMNLLKGYVIKITEMTPTKILSFNRENIVNSDVPTMEYIGFNPADGKKMIPVSSEKFKRPVLVTEDEEEEENED